MALRRRRDFSAERVDHELQSVADAEHGNAEIEHALVGVRGILVVHRRRPARQNDADRVIAADLVEPGVEGKYDGEDLVFTDWVSTYECLRFSA